MTLSPASAPGLPSRTPSQTYPSRASPLPFLLHRSHPSPSSPSPSTGRLMPANKPSARNVVFISSPSAPNMGHPFIPVSESTSTSLLGQPPRVAFILTPASVPACLASATGLSAYPRPPPAKFEPSSQLSVPHLAPAVARLSHLSDHIHDATLLSVSCVSPDIAVPFVPSFSPGPPSTTNRPSLESRVCACSPTIVDAVRYH
ncbi:hypothetical protein BD311DRAFT_282732 [Dichomitus squalens]|uniref:Uncharacterized protein n=1 Tax=Dichomitus squalens TaxID=114155 RepID=A0A4Q9N3B4_9APHY|nr:hypothetical protein BD311DRAFT_282732 [Dichomitus squalens]